MMKTLKPLEKIALNPSTLLAPVPAALISCCGPEGSDIDKPNLITLAWVGTVCSEPPMLSISIRKSRFSHRQIMETGEFVVNLVSRDLLWATDYCGVKSGRDLDKFAACHLSAVPAAGLQTAPAVAESPLSLSCRVRQVLELGSHDCFIAEIVAVEAAKELVDSQQRLQLENAGLVAYNHGDYYGMGDKLGFFGFSVARKDVLARRMPKERVPQAEATKKAPVPKKRYQKKDGGK